MKQHIIEQVVDLLVERAHSYLDILENAYSVDGRVAFNVKLTDEEQLQRYHNPQMREQIIADIYRDEGIRGVGNYIEKMRKLEVKYAR